MQSGLTAFKIKKVLGLFLAVLLGTACVHQTVQTTPAPPTTLVTFEGPYDAIWNTTLSVLYDERQIPLNLANKEAGILASDWVREERTLHDAQTNAYLRYPSRYRINVSLRRMPAVNLPAGIERVTVIVNKQMELNTTGTWQAYPSDHDTETKILTSIGKHLGKDVEKQKR